MSADSDTHYALIGDIGGTNVRLEHISFTGKSDARTTLKKAQLKTNKFKSFSDALIDFLSDISKDEWPEVATIGVAGPVLNNSAKLTNATWPKFSGADLAKTSKIAEVKIFNDFEMNSYAVTTMTPSDLIQLAGPAQPDKEAIKVVTGPGTGLGMALVVPNRIQDKIVHQVWPGEGGHQGFPQPYKIQQQYYNFLKKKFPEKGNFIGLEYCFAGPAFPHLYEFVCKTFPDLKGDLEVDFPDYKKNFPSVAAFKRGVESLSGRRAGDRRADEKCLKMVELFVQMYGNLCGDIALCTRAFGGIYLTGAISIAVAEFLKKRPELFMGDYKKCRASHTGFINQVPVYICKKEDIGLDGGYVNIFFKHNNL